MKKIIALGVLVVVLGLGVFAFRVQTKAALDPQTKVQVATQVSQALVSFSGSLRAFQSSFVRDQAQFASLRVQLATIAQGLDSIARMPMNTPAERQAVQAALQQTTMTVNAISANLTTIQTRYQAQFQILKDLTTSFQTLVPLLSEALK